jgi:hypothetical protein
MKHAWILAILTTSCFAQDSFWTKERKVETTGIVAESIVDGYTTQRLINAHHTELNPLAAPMVNRGTAGQVAASALGVGAAVGVQYLLYRTGHRKASRWAGHIILVAEGVNVGRQISLVRSLP